MLEHSMPQCVCVCIAPCIKVRRPWLNKIWESECQITQSNNCIGSDDWFRRLEEGRRERRMCVCVCRWWGVVGEVVK